MRMILVVVLDAAAGPLPCSLAASFAAGAGVEVGRISFRATGISRRVHTNILGLQQQQFGEQQQWQ
jgi:hypothetical protein